MIKRLFIANRGEIARRIILAARELGIETVALVTPPDHNAPFASMATIRIDRSCDPPSRAYLDPTVVLDAIRTSGADAVHPGYGFLSENADFAQACAEAGFTFVGPPPNAMRAVGDKIRAKQLMAAAGVSVVPGYQGEDQSLATLKKEAMTIGFPLLIKASGGGGGRGMRLIRDLSSFETELTEAQREAKAGFGDDRVLLERYVENPRHIEFQIFGMPNGKVLHLFERECSIQRRHQKIIEESPSPIMNPELRQQMADAAVLAGTTAGYMNAGTVEFLLESPVDGPPRFFFLEVNARLQVEHPVTEMVTGVDLVKAQLRTASGIDPEITLPSAPNGHAIEARLYAESPATGFLPSIGRLAEWIEPQAPWVRVDSGVAAGGEISPYFDPMIAKIIAWGENRREAIARLEAALRSTVILGVDTNAEYLLAILADEQFRQGATTIRFLEERFADWRPAPPPTEAIVAAAILSKSAHKSRASKSQGASRIGSPWEDISQWRNSRGAAAP